MSICIELTWLLHEYISLYTSLPAQRKRTSDTAHQKKLPCFSMCIKECSCACAFDFSILNMQRIFTIANIQKYTYPALNTRHIAMQYEEVEDRCTLGLRRFCIFQSFQESQISNEYDNEALCLSQANRIQAYRRHALFTRHNDDVARSAICPIRSATRVNFKTIKVFFTLNYLHTIYCVETQTVWVVANLTTIWSKIMSRRKLSICSFIATFTMTNHLRNFSAFTSAVAVNRELSPWQLEHPSFESSLPHKSMMHLQLSDCVCPFFQDLISDATRK